VAAELMLDVLNHLGENGFGVRHRLVDLRDPVVVFLLGVDLPRSIAARRATHLKKYEARSPLKQLVSK